MIIEPTVKANVFDGKVLEDNSVNEKLMAEKEKYLSENSGLKDENQKLKEENEELKRQLAEAKLTDKKSKKGGE